ncbi:MAG: hypothetical protein LBP87_07575, partial [Planctomycetaceae bacterium]|nr:hypothetical protein [Planctomycetaceae bacterium]
FTHRHNSCSGPKTVSLFSVGNQKTRRWNNTNCQCSSNSLSASTPTDLCGEGLSPTVGYLMITNSKGRQRFAENVASAYSPTVTPVFGRKSETQTFGNTNCHR